MYGYGEAAGFRILAWFQTVLKSELQRMLWPTIGKYIMHHLATCNGGVKSFGLRSLGNDYPDSIVVFYTHF